MKHDNYPEGYRPVESKLLHEIKTGSYREYLFPLESDLWWSISVPLGDAGTRINRLRWRIGESLKDGDDE